MASNAWCGKVRDNVSPLAKACYGGGVRELPPYASLLGLRFDGSGAGLLVTMPFHDDVVGRPGYLHGGAIAGLLEFAAYASLSRALADDSVAMKPVTVTINYMRPGIDRDTFAAATVERLGASVANVESFAWQESREQPIASARLNFLLDRTASGASG